MKLLVNTGVEIICQSDTQKKISCRKGSELRLGCYRSKKKNHFPKKYRKFQKKINNEVPLEMSLSGDRVDDCPHTLSTHTFKSRLYLMSKDYLIISTRPYNSGYN